MPIRMFAPHRFLPPAYFIPLLAGFTVLLSVDACAQSPADSVVDPKAKPVVEQIVKKLNTVKDYTATVTNKATTAKGNLSRTEQFWYKPPSVLTIQTNTEHPAPIMLGSVTHVYDDGKSIVLHTAPGAGAYQAYYEMFHKNSKDPVVAQNLAAESATQKAFRYDRAKLMAAGKAGDNPFYQEWIASPFDKCDPSTIKLVGETSDTWTLSATFTYGPEKHEGTLQFGKQDGVLRSGEFNGSMGKNLLTISDVRINPNPPTADSVFVYTAPAGITVKDGTDDLLKSLARQAASR